MPPMRPAALPQARLLAPGLTRFCHVGAPSSQANASDAWHADRLSSMAWKRPGVSRLVRMKPSSVRRDSNAVWSANGARNGGSARGYQRDLHHARCPADQRSAQHAAARFEYLFMAGPQGECPHLPPTGRALGRCVVPSNALLCGLRVAVTAVTPAAGRGGEGGPQEPRPGRSGRRRGPRSTSRSDPRAPQPAP